MGQLKRKLTKSEMKMMAMRIHIMTGKKLFDWDTPAPLAIGIHKQMLKMDFGFSKRFMRAFIKGWVRRPKYRIQIIKQKWRYNIDGSVSGPVEQSMKDQAAETLDKMGYKYDTAQT